MSIRPIVVYGDPVLHRRAETVERFDEELHALVADMRETLAASNGVGLAAPQIGVAARIFLYDALDHEGVQRSGVVINPTLVTSKIPGGKPDPDDDAEGCLSVPALNYPLARADWAKVTGVDEFGAPVEIEARDWFARVMQHEYDHLLGKLYVDRLTDRWARKWKKAQKSLGWTEAGRSWLPGTDPDPFGH